MLQSSDELGHVAEELLDFFRRVPGNQSLQLRQIESELETLRAEFRGFEWDRQRRTLSVVVGPVELEGIRLGRFEIILQCNRLEERRPYEVVALTPNPASVDQQVTHPHVRGNLLCEGEGTPLFDWRWISGGCTTSLNSRHGCWTPTTRWRLTSA